MNGKACENTETFLTNFIKNWWDPNRDDGMVKETKNQ